MKQLSNDELVEIGDRLGGCSHWDDLQRTTTDCIECYIELCRAVENAVMKKWEEA